MDIQLVIYNGGTAYVPVLEGEIIWNLERQGAPGQLKFKVMKDETVNFQEGNKVTLKVDGKDVFLGFVFTKSRDKNGVISVTAYDQIRYLKNKDSIQYEDLSASELISQIAGDFRLNLGEIEDTGFKLSRTESNTSLMDIIQNALDETLLRTKQMYVLYDAYGKLTLKSLGAMASGEKVLITEDTAADFSYTSSIDTDTYNQVKLIYYDEEEGTAVPFMKQHSENINSWGVLQHLDTVESEEGADAKAEALLALYNHKSRNLTVKEAFGSLSVRAGSFVAVHLNIGDIIVSNSLMVESCTHRFTKSAHFMDLVLRGGEFS